MSRAHLMKMKTGQRFKGSQVGSWRDRFPVSRRQAKKMTVKAQTSSASHIPRNYRKSSKASFTSEGLQILVNS